MNGSSTHLVPSGSSYSAPTFEFEGKSLALFRCGERWACKARDLGRFLDYSADGKRLLIKITKDWADEFTEGVEYFRGSAGVPGSGTLQSHEIILTQEGINSVCLLTHKPIGKATREWLRRDVMMQPQIAVAAAPHQTAPQLTAESIAQANVNAMVPLFREMTLSLGQAIATAIAPLADRNQALAGNQRSTRLPKKDPSQVGQGPIINIDEARDLRERGWKLSEISDKYGITEAAVSKSLRRDRERQVVKLPIKDVSLESGIKAVLHKLPGLGVGGTFARSTMMLWIFGDDAGRTRASDCTPWSDWLINQGYIAVNSTAHRSDGKGLRRMNFVVLKIEPGIAPKKKNAA